MTVSIVVKSERRFGAYEMITFTGSLVLGRRAESMFRLHDSTESPQKGRGDVRSPRSRERSTA